MSSGSGGSAPARRGRPPRSAPPGPTRQDVIRAVARLAQERQDGVITMRDLAQALGVSPKLLYRHVSGKDELLELTAAAILETWNAPSPDLPWPERLAAILRSTRAMARRFPGLATPMLLRVLEDRESPEVHGVVATVKDCLEEAGLSSEEANHVFAAYGALALGEVAIAQAVQSGALSDARGARSQTALDAGVETGLRYLIAGIIASHGAATPKESAE